MYREPLVEYYRRLRAPTERKIEQYFAWNTSVNRFFNTYEEAHRFSEEVFEKTGSVVAIEPVYAI